MRACLGHLVQKPALERVLEHEPTGDRRRPFGVPHPAERAPRVPFAAAELPKAEKECVLCDLDHVAMGRYWDNSRVRGGDAAERSLDQRMVPANECENNGVVVAGVRLIFGHFAIKSFDLFMIFPTSHTIKRRIPGWLSVCGKLLESSYIHNMYNKYYFTNRCFPGINSMVV